MLSASRASVFQGLVEMMGNPLRTALSTLGIVIGVAALIATLSLTDGLERYARQQLETNTDVQSITVSSRTAQIIDGFSYPLSGFPVFGLFDAADLQRELGSSAEVTMLASGQAVVKSTSALPHVSTVTATLSNYLAFGHKDLFAGRFFTDGEAGRNAGVVVLSYKLAHDLSPSGEPSTMIDHVVRVHGRPLLVVGIMTPYLGERGFQVFVPVRAASTTFGAADLITPELIVRAPAIEAVDATKGFIYDWLATRYHNWSRLVSVTSAEASLQEAQSAMLIFKLIMGALSGISLVVGGVGIMNVLLASVAERTREIGVRKALGARRRDILYQFLAESVAIAGIGSGIGTACGFSGAFAVAAIVRSKIPGAHLYAAITPATVTTSILSAAIVGLTFGTLPALRASRLSPIDAIRHE